MFSDFLAILEWWFILFLFGVAAFPLTARLFPNFLDRGYALARVLGIVLVSYLLFLGAHLKLLSIDQPTIVLILILIAIFGVYQRLLTADKLSRLPWKLLVLEEALFFLCLWFWSVVRAFAPELHGLEKYMDFGFVNSILVGKTLPPLDIWLTHAADYPHYFINYYYFGHFVTALLSKLSGIDSAVTYNLMLATLFAFTFTLSFSIGLNLFHFFQKMWHKAHDKLTQPIIVGIIAAFLVALGGNLHTIYLFTRGYPNDNPLPFWQILSGYNPQNYWYPNATRFIPYTIHEFPIYSFVVSDLHGHVLDIPFVLFTLAFLLNLITQTSKQQAQGRVSSFQSGALRAVSSLIGNSQFAIGNLIFLGLLLAVMYMTNAWDGIIYFVLGGLVLLYRNYREQKDLKLGGWHALTKTAIQGLLLVFTFILFTLPFSLNFKPFVSGFGVVCPPSFLAGKSLGPFIFEEGDKCARSPIWMLAVLWGFFYYNVLGFLAFVIWPALRRKITNHQDTRNKQSSIIPSTSLRVHPENSHRGASNQQSSILEKFSQLPPTDVFILLLIFVSTLLLIFPEFFYAKDIYPLHYRANTMFKLGYQAFMMLQIASSYIFFRILSLESENSEQYTRRRFAAIALPKVLWLFGFAIAFYFVSVYPYFAITSYYGNLKYYKGLNGLIWFTQQYPDDAKAVLWLRTQLAKGQLQTGNRQPFDPEQSRGTQGKPATLRSRAESRDSGQAYNLPVILEANGESYTDYARVSAYTGLPTVIGWPVHEWLWRGSYDEPGKRIPLVERMYTSLDVTEVKDLLGKYQLSYVFVGTLERQKYPTLTEEVFKQLGEVVFESGDTRVYKVH